MNGWVLMFSIFAGGLFLIKICYVISTALVLPRTRGAIYVSTSGKKIDAALTAVPMSAGQLLVDIGCGDGRVLRRAWQRYGVRALGYEINPMAYTRAQLQCLGYKDVTVRLRNFWQDNLTKADVIFCYLYPDLMADLAGKFKSELQSETRVISCNFELPGCIPESIVQLDHSLHNDPIYIYRFPQQNDPLSLSLLQ